MTASLRKIVHVVGGGARTGSARVVLDLCRELDARRWRSAICFFSIVDLDAGLRAEVESIGVPYRSVVKRSRYELRALDRLVAALSELRPDVVVLHGFGAYSYGALAAHLLEVRPLVVRYEHNPELYGPLYRLFSAGTARWVHSSIAVSRYVLDYVNRAGTMLPRAEVIDNGVRLEPYLSIRVAPFFDPERTPVVVMPARLDVQKDHATLLDAVAIVTSKGQPIDLRFAGVGPIEQQLRERATALGITVSFLGYRSDMAQVIADADIVALSTRYEGFGLVLVEAMAALRPVIATATTAIPEVVQDGVEGLLVPPGDPTGLANAILTLVRDRDRARRMGAAGRVRAVERFSLERMIMRFESHLERALVARGGSERTPLARVET